MKDSCKTLAVIFAGGIGSRMGTGSGPKQFVKIKGKPIIAYTLQHFQNHKRVDGIYIACLEGHISDLRKCVNDYGLSKVRGIVKGGASAQESIFFALHAAISDPDNSGNEIVLIHDSVRPIINDRLIDENINSVVSVGSAISSIPAFETVAKSLDRGRTIEEVTSRDLMFILQAPQSFRLEHVYSLNKRALDDGLMGAFVDQAHLMNHYGEALAMVEGFRGNVKITVPLDIAHFEFLVDSGEFKAVTGETIS